MKLQRSFFVKLCCVLLPVFYSTFSLGQCSTVIDSFPYNEDFEATNGGWVTGGISSDWAWGKPSKPVINKAFSGQKCWITGGLNGSSYADNESSWLKSPCFDFTNLQHPYISFEVFWETELKYDGAAIQYSLDGGISWSNLFDANVRSDCFNSAWYNYASVVFLSSLGATDGWSGNIQSSNGGNCLTGNGSGHWHTRQHTLPFLAGKPNVIFRFVFASGNICNSYDGFAFDHIYIGEAPALIANFTYTCRGSRILDFENDHQTCQNSFLWNFGDTASGTANTSIQENASHQFSAPGNYTVTFIVSGTGLSSSTLSKNVIVLDADAHVISPLLCNGDSNATAVATGKGASDYVYTWSTNPVQKKDTATNLSAGTYIVQVDAVNACSITQQVTINEPEALQATVQTKDAICTANNGSVSVVVTGGTAPYTYSWDSNHANTAAVSNLPSGTYSVEIKDANACMLVKSNMNVVSINPLKIFLGNDTSICPGSYFMLQPGDFESYLWQDNSTASSFKVINGGVFWVRVLDSFGCMASDTILVEEDCGEINFASAFTPNGDGKNDYFGPLGNLDALSNYHFVIYNRWGQLIFQSNDPYKKWDGKVDKHSGSINIFAWMATFTYHEKNISRKGTITLIR